MMLFSIVFSLYFGAVVICDRHPILLVPGLGGSQIISKYIENPKLVRCNALNKSFLSWINPIYFTPFTVNCIISLLKLEYNTSSHSTYPPKYCETSIPGFGNVNTISYLSNIKIPLTSYYSEIIKDLVKTHKYTANIDIRGAPYDFRKGPNELGIYLDNVKSLIEEMYYKRNGKSVVIICHSLGCLLTLRILNKMPQEWKDKYIRSFVSISAPYAGSMVAVESVLSGFKSATFFINPLRLRLLESSWPSLFYLMPINGIWPNESIVLTTGKNFSANNISEMLKLSQVKFAFDHYNDILDEMDERQAPNVEVHCLTSFNLPTTAVLDYRKVNFPDSTPKKIMQSGDGTVPFQSLNKCAQWKTKQAKPVASYMISNVKHLKMIKHKFTVKTISKIISTINQ